MNEQLEAASRQIKQGKEAQKQQFLEDSKERLFRIIEKKLNTAFIGALAKFEMRFGKLWGHGKIDAELTDQEKRFRKVWRETRADVLTNGNNQIRAVDQEFGQYTMRWNGFSLELSCKEQQSE